METIRLWSSWSRLQELLVPHYIFNFLVIFAIYVLAAYVGLEIAPVNKFATLVWAPTGISLAWLFLFGFRYWPAIFMAAFFINLFTGASVAGAFGIAIGNTLEALVGSYLLRLANFEASLSTVPDVVRLVVLGALVSTLVSATIGVGSLLATRAIELGQFGATWVVWWIGDMLGDLIVASVVLTSWALFARSINFPALAATAFVLSPERSGIFGLKARVFGSRISRINYLELGGWATATLLIPWFVFNQSSAPLRYAPSIYMIFLPIIWGAVRLRQPWVAVGVLILAVVAIWQTTRGMGPFASPSIEQGLFFLQIFIGTVSVAGLILTAAVSEARQSKEKVLELNESLKKEIQEVERLNSLMMKYIKENRIKRLKKRFGEQSKGKV